MTLSTWLLYALAVLVLTVTPGPSVLMCVSTAIKCGPGKAMLAAMGSTTAIVGLMTLSSLGLGTALAASEALFTVLKWLGAAYLAYIGVRSLLTKSTEMSFTDAVDAATNARVFAQGLGVGVSNPKALLFFGALFPQFLVPSAPQLPQFLLLGATFVFFELLWLTIYALTAARAKRWLQQPRRATLFHRATGIVFLAAAGLVASIKRLGAV